MSNYSDSQFNFSDPNTSWHKTFHLVPENSCVLDIGCSTGNFGEQLIKQKKCIVDGIEIDDGDINEAKKRLRKVYKINIETEDVKLSQKYDVVFLGDVIEHLAKPSTTLKKLHSLLNKEGVLLFSMPNITHMSVRLMMLEGKIEYGRTGLLDETHLHFYNREEIYRVLNSAGFEVIKFDYTINDIPFEKAKENLKKMGLTPNDEFKKLLKTTNAAAYQFIGIAKVNKSIKPQKLPKLSPHNIVEDYINDMKGEYENAIKGLKEDRAKIIKDLNNLIKERDSLEQQLGVINKLVRKLKNKARTIKGVINKK